MAWDICCYYKRKKRKTKEEILDFPRPRARLQFSWLGKQHYQKKPVSMVLSMTPGCVGIPFWGSNETHELLSIAQGKHLTAHLVLGPLCIVLCFVCLLSRALARSYTICVVLGYWEPRQKLQLQEDFWAEPRKQKNEGAGATASGHYLLMFLSALSCIVLCLCPVLSLKLWLPPAPIWQSLDKVATLHSMPPLLALSTHYHPCQNPPHSLLLLLALPWSCPGRWIQFLDTDNIEILFFSVMIY